MRSRAVLILTVCLAAVVLVVDQTAKYLVATNLPYEKSVPVLGSVLSFFYVRNSGAAFSLGEGFAWVFSVVMVVVATLIAYLLITRVRSRLWAVALGLLLGGVLGNLTDRLFRAPGWGMGHVVDFISTPWMMPAIYNIADSCIVVSMIGVGILVVTGVRFDGTREKSDKSEETGLAE